MSWMSQSTVLASIAGLGVCFHAWIASRAEAPSIHRKLNTTGAIALVLVWLLLVPAAVVLWRQGLSAPWLFGAETYDGGVSETVTGLALAASALLALHQATRSTAWLRRLIFCGIGSVAFLAFGEETSWGQHLFQWSAGGVFATANLQAETNLHNFVSPRLYDVAYVAIGWGLIVFAALLSFRPRWTARINSQSLFPKPSRIGIALVVSGGVLLQHEVFEELAEAVTIVALVFFQAHQYCDCRASGRAECKLQPGASEGLKSQQSRKFAILGS